MSFGSDTPGGSPEGIGGNESGIGGGGYGGGGGDYSGIDTSLEDFFGDLDRASAGYGYESEVANALSRLSVYEQERLFRDIIDPMMSRTYNPITDTGNRVMGYALNAMLNAVVPGLGLVAGVTGMTRKATDWLRDNTVTQALQDILDVTQTGQPYNSGMDVIEAARSSGKSEEEIANAFNLVSAMRGGTMGLWEDITGESAAGAATGAARTAASYQQQAIDYMKQMGAPALAAQQQLGQIYGTTGTAREQRRAIGDLRQSPLYTAIMSGKEQGEEALMRRAGATGGLRSGNLQGALYDYNTQLEQQALLSGLQGITGLAGMGTYTPQIAGTMAGIGGTLAAGQTAAAQAEQAGMGNLLGLGGTLFKELGGFSGIADIGGDIIDTVSGWF